MITPSVKASRPASILRAVDFPHPDGPTTTMNSLSLTSRHKSFTAISSAANRLVTCRKLADAIGASLTGRINQPSGGARHSHPFPAFGRLDGCGHQRDGAEVVSAGGFGLTVRTQRARKFSERARAVDVGHRRQSHRAPLAASRPHDHAIQQNVVLAAARPEELPALELHTPLTCPRCLRAGADPAPSIADHHSTIEQHRCDRHGRALVTAPRRIRGFTQDFPWLAGKDETE